MPQRFGASAFLHPPNHPGEFALALPALASQDQVAALNMAGKVGDGDVGSAVPTPNIAQKALAAASLSSFACVSRV